MIGKALRKALPVVASGAAVYFFDPDRGRARRAMAADRLLGSARHTARHASRSAQGEIRHAEGRFEGALARAQGRGRYHPESDTDLREHLRQVVGAAPSATSDVTVDVAGGVAVLRGQVASDAEMEDLVRRVNGVEGVDRTENFLHLPGEAAPNKEAAIRAGS